MVIAISLLVTRVAVVVLTATGLPKQQARFQARSAFTGAGFTTGESEAIVNDPLRRRVVMMLMLLGNAGIVASAGTLIIGFGSGGSGPAFGKVAELALGLFALLYASRSRYVDRWLTTVASRAVHRYTRVLALDREELLTLPNGHVVVELPVRRGDAFVERKLETLSLSGQGVTVLGIRSAGAEYESDPPDERVVHAGDTLYLYGTAACVGAAARARGRDPAPVTD